MQLLILFVVLQVAKVAGSKWLQIGVHLGFKTHELDEFEEREPKSLHSRFFRLLVAWKNKVELPTVGTLVLACEEAGIGGAARRAIQVPKKD